MYSYAERPDSKPSERSDRLNPAADWPVTPVLLAPNQLGLQAIELGNVTAGFPSPAEDHCAKRIDLIERLRAANKTGRASERR